MSLCEWVCVHASTFWIHFNEPHCTTQRCALRGATQGREYGGAGTRPTSVGGSGNELTVGVLAWGQARGNALILTKTLFYFFSLSAQDVCEERCSLSSDVLRLSPAFQISPATQDGGLSKDRRIFYYHFFSLWWWCVSVVHCSFMSNAH